MLHAIRRRDSAVFGQFEPSFGVIAASGAVHHFTRLMGAGAWHGNGLSIDSPRSIKRRFDGFFDQVLGRLPPSKGGKSRIAV